jgi:thioredoxin 1|tara:strand:- start:94 stop:420 length:327 start_codon:yes stop_codon:yes gene_type:complete
MTHNDEVPELSEKEFENHIKSDLVLIDFAADWCMPCIMMAPIIDELSKKFKGKINFGKVNIEDNQELAQKFDIVSLPNFILFKNGKQIEQFIGAMPSEEFEKKLKNFV